MQRFTLSHVLLVASACSLLLACENNTRSNSPNPTAPTASSPSNNPGQSNTPSPSSPLNGVYPFNSSVRYIPPKPFQNHWAPSQPTVAKPAPFYPFLRREGRRISFSKLKTSIPFLFGGITWTDKAGNNLFDKFALTLGKADYVEINKDNDSVTKLFMKMMDDMATNVCKQAIAADYKLAANQRQFVRFETDVDENLRFLRMKFHATFVPKTSTEGLTHLKNLYTQTLAKTNNNAKTAWELVCIAVLTSPEFYVY